MKPQNKVRMRDLAIRDEVLLEEYIDVFREVLTSGALILSPKNEELEELIRKITGSRYASVCSSASSGLYLALKALNIGPGDEVITTPMSWLVSSSAILQVGAVPVFVDVDENYNLNPAEVVRAINPSTKAVLVVHYYGRLAQIQDLQKLAQEHNLYLIEDCAQSFGVQKDKVFTGTFGDVGVFSFSPMKVVGGFGDAGAVVTKHKHIYERINVLRHCGTVDREVCISPESKHIMDSLHAALLIKILPTYEELIHHRRRLGLRYIEGLNDVVDCPNLGNETEHSSYDFPIKLKDRNALHSFLNGLGIESRVRHPLLISDQPVHKNSKKFPLVRAKQFVNEILCLPMHNNMQAHEVDIVIGAVRQFKLGR